ncbi:DUF4917 family protein [Candidatus Omnitrophota bacterium]
MSVKVIKFSKALKEATALGQKKQLLLGNGFSIGGHSSFSYGTLLEQARKDHLPKHFEALFIRYGNDFEDILKYLDEGVFLANLYKLKKDTKVTYDMRRDYKKLRNVLVKTISDNHPDFPNKITDEKFDSCLKFLKNFDAVFTLNYDLLLYWASLHIDEKQGEVFPFRDGFCREDDPDDPDCSFSASSIGSKPYIFFLHGALHLYTEKGLVWKRVYNTNVIPIIDQVRIAFESKQYPLFVAEGSSVHKMKKIESSSYLSNALRKFKNLQGHLFIYGHSLCEQDYHIFNSIVHSFKLSHLWIGLYGGVKKKENLDIVLKAQSLIEKRNEIIPKAMKKKGAGELNIAFFESSSANVW